MSTLSVPNNQPTCQAETESALNIFRRYLPCKMIGADRSAYQYQRSLPKAWALQCSEIKANDNKRIVCITVDVDSETASTAWLDAEIAPPNLVIQNPTNGHAHLVWLFDDVLYLSTQHNAPRYAKAIQRALTFALAPFGGDPSFSWPNAFMHNPFHERYRTREIHNRLYRLDDLAQGLDLQPIRHCQTTTIQDIAGLQEGERNEGLFRFLLSSAPRVMGRCKDSTAYYEQMADLAFGTNATFDPPLPTKEVGTTLKSVLHYRRFRKRNRAAERKAKRHADGHSKERFDREMRARIVETHRLAKLKTPWAEIARRIGVTPRTIARYLNKNEYMIGVARIQGNARPSTAMATAEATASGADRVVLANNISFVLTTAVRSGERMTRCVRINDDLRVASASGSGYG